VDSFKKVFFPGAANHVQPIARRPTVLVLSSAPSWIRSAFSGLKIIPPKKGTREPDDCPTFLPCFICLHAIVHLDRASDGSHSSPIQVIAARGTNRRGRPRRGRGGATRGGAVAAASGTARQRYAAAVPAAKAIAPAQPVVKQAAAEAYKVIVSNLPQDVTEASIRVRAF
jgi:hypothetical protein